MRLASVQVLLPAVATQLDIPIQHSNFSRNWVVNLLEKCSIARTGFQRKLFQTVPESR
jgi:hypothetical protein